MRLDPLGPSAQLNETLSLVVHAGAKVGKTTLASTSPKPLLLLDAEGGTKFLRWLGWRTVQWDPITGPPPAWDGTWDICSVNVWRYEVMSMAYQWLATGQHTFASLAVDSHTEVQRRCKQTLDFEGRNTQAAWGKLLDNMLGLTRDLRDLTLHPTNPLSSVMFIAESRFRDNKWRPYMQGQLADSLPYTVDVLGYLFVAQVADLNDPTILHQQRQLLVAPVDPSIEAGERVQGRLGYVVPEPNVELMLRTVYPQPTEQGAYA